MSGKVVKKNILLVIAVFGLLLAIIMGIMYWKLSATKTCYWVDESNMGVSLNEESLRHKTENGKTYVELCN